MPHFCTSTITHHFHGLVEFVISDNAFKIVEVTAAGSALLGKWTKVRKVLISALVILLASVSITKLPASEAWTFAQRMRKCQWNAAPKQQAPEPVKNSPNRQAYKGYETSLSA